MMPKNAAVPCSNIGSMEMAKYLVRGTILLKYSKTVNLKNLHQISNQLLRQCEVF